VGLAGELAQQFHDHVAVTRERRALADEAQWAALRDREQPAQLLVSRVARTGCQPLLEPRPVAGDYLSAVAVSPKDERVAQGRWAADGHVAGLWRIRAPVTDRDRVRLSHLVAPEEAVPQRQSPGDATHPMILRYVLLYAPRCRAT
jgi:hypothetical protein